MISIISGFLSILYSETRSQIKSFLSSYIWFSALAFLSIYALFSQMYVDMNVDRSLMAFKYENNPMTEVLLFIISFGVTSSSEIMAGKIPVMVFPVSIGVIFFILFPFMLSLTFIGNQMIKKASTTISGEVEKKMLFIMVSSPQTRPSIYLGKLISLFLMTLPLILLFYFITDWIFKSLFSSAYNASILVLQVLIINAVLFSSAGMLVSSVFRNEKTASRAGKRLIAISAGLTSLWMVIPVIEFMLNMTRNNIVYLGYFEKVTWISPFTLELMSVYDPSVFPEIFYILTAVSVIFLALGMVTFIRQDLEY